MKIANIQKLAAHTRKVAAEARSTGPKTEKGKLRSALNATRHGLSGMHIVLPGEDGAEYERRLSTVFADLAPHDEAQAQLVALIADGLWKLERLGKMEHAVILARIEELLGLTASAEMASTLSTAMAGMASAITTWEMQPRPIVRGEEFSRRLAMMSSAIGYVSLSVPGISRDITTTCDDLLGRLRGKENDTEVPQDTYIGLAQAARVLMTTLIMQGEQLDATQDGLRKAIASVALPDEAEMKKVARYTKLLEDSLQRRLAALDQLRKLTAGQAVTKEDADRAQEYRVRLRLVS